MKLALGAAQFGSHYGVSNSSGQVSSDEAKKILQYAKKIGITTLDTAIAYGESEQRLGNIGVEDWQIISKLPGIPQNCVDVSAWVFESVVTSLKRLKVENIYGFLLHCPQDLLGKDSAQLYGALLGLKKSGRIQKIGISIYDPVELDALCSRYQFDIVQAPFNLLDARLLDSGWLSRLKVQGVEVHVRSVFLQGLLLMSPNERERKFSRWSSTWSYLEQWLREKKLNSLQACLRYALSFSEIDKVIIGVDSLSQLKEIHASAVGPKPEVPLKLRTNDVDLLNPARWNLQ